MKKMHYKDSPSEEERKAFKPYLSEDEELVIATGFGSAHLRQRFIIQLILPFGIFILAGLGLSYFLKWNLGWGLLLGLLLAVAASLLKTLHLYHANRYLLTTRRVVIKKGIFAVRLTSAMYDKITHLEVDQTFLDKLLYHHGTILINIAGMHKDEIALKYVDYPIELKNLMERLINREREQFGLRGGSVTAVEGEIL